MHMVSYQKWTEIAFEVAQSRGLESSQDAAAELISVAARIWNSRKQQLETATVAEARQIASDEIQVQR